MKTKLNTLSFFVMTNIHTLIEPETSGGANSKISNQALDQPQMSYLKSILVTAEPNIHLMD